MFGDIGFAELLLIGIVALIVVGPEDLPQMFRQLGRFTAKIKSMGREFSRAMEQAAADTGVKDVAKDLKAATSAKAMGLDKVKEAADRFEKWDPIKNAAKPSTPAKPLVPPAMPATPMPATPMPATPATVMPSSLADAPDAATPQAAVPERILGPQTQALMDKKAAKQAILAETQARLKAVSEGTAPPPAVKTAAVKASAVKAPAVKAAPKPRAKKPVVATDAAPAQSPSKTKKADQA